MMVDKCVKVKQIMCYFSKLNEIIILTFVVEVLQNQGRVSLYTYYIHEEEFVYKYILVPIH